MMLLTIMIGRSSLESHLQKEKENGKKKEEKKGCLQKKSLRVEMRRACYYPWESIGYLFLERR